MIRTQSEYKGKLLKLKEDSKTLKELSVEGEDESTAILVEDWAENVLNKTTFLTKDKLYGHLDKSNLARIVGLDELELDECEVCSTGKVPSAIHPVWSILKKEKYVEEFYPKAEEMYDFIRNLCISAGKVTKDGDTVPAMKVFFDMWNTYETETFAILADITESKGVREIKSF